MIACAQILTESPDNMQKFPSSSTEVLDATTAHLLAVSTLMTAIPPLGRRACRDATDGGMLACARAARTDYVVTGDRDLPSLSTFEAIPIIPPHSFEAPFTD